MGVLLRCFFLTVVVLILVGGCSFEDGSPLLPKSSEIPLDELKGAPECIYLEGQECRLETYLWRDFMPICPPDGQLLIAMISVVGQNGGAIPADVKLKYLWVINGIQVWAVTFSEEPQHPENELQRIARDGPKWGPHIFVDVVVGLTRSNGRLLLLRAVDQWIARTD